MNPLSEAALWCRTLDDSFVRLQAGHSLAEHPSQRTWCFNHQKRTDNSSSTLRLAHQGLAGKLHCHGNLAAGSALLGLLLGLLNLCSNQTLEMGRATEGCGPGGAAEPASVPGGITFSSRDKPKPCATLLSPCLTPDEETALFKGWSASEKILKCAACQ